MSEERKEEVRVSRSAGYERRQRVVEHAPTTRAVFVSRLNKLIWLIGRDNYRTDSHSGHSEIDCSQPGEHLCQFCL